MMPQDLQKALESDCSHAVEPILEARRAEHFDALVGLLETAAAPPDQLAKTIRLLGHWGDPAPAARIAALLPRLDEVGRCAAIAALAQLDAPVARGAVLGRAHDPSPHVRKFVAKALRRDPSIAARERLEEMARGDREGFVRAAAERGLAER